MEDAFDPSMNILHRRPVQLDALFHPKTIALIGASEKPASVGRTLMENLREGGFSGTLYPVNPQRDTVFSEKCYPDVREIPGEIDLAILVTPAKTVPSLIEQCVEKKVKGAIVISAGFKEMGPEGEALEKKILTSARGGKMRLIGPNCLGVMVPQAKLNATFAADMALEGQIAFISQSGALCTAVLDWSLKENVGFSAFVSVGSMVDVGWGDLIDYFGSDPATKSILIYMESLFDARSFLSAARQVALTKPIILIKAGRSEESAQAAASHTGALAGSDEALSAALRRSGVLRVDTIADLFGMAEVLAKQPRPKGPHLAIVTNAGGPGVIATDALIQQGAKLATLEDTTREQLSAILPPHWSHNNPIDLLGDASPSIYAKAVDIIQNSSEADGILVILTPQDMTDPTQSAQALSSFAHTDKPLLASWMGGDMVQEGDQLLSRAGVPVFSYPDLACKTFANMWKYTENLRSIYEVPSLVRFVEDPQSYREKKERIDQILQTARASGRTLLDEYESKQVLEAYRIPTVPTSVAFSREEAVEQARRMGFPVVLKLYSHTLTHKSDVGGVKLHLGDAPSVERAYEEIAQSVQEKAGPEHFKGVTVQPMISLSGYELILGSIVDAQFGPVVLFGSGGQLVEVYQDRALAIPPLTTTLARRTMEQTKIYRALQGVRGRKGVDLNKLEEIFVRFSHLIIEEPWIKECDINPLLASEEGFLALDARIVLFDPEETCPQPAIRPYPMQYVESWTLSEGTVLHTRPIRPDDEPLVAQFYKDLSNETIRQRYLKVLNYEQRVLHERLLRICFTDYDREIALVVLKDLQILGMIRLSKIPGTKEALFALLIKDQWQNRGIGSKLMERILLIARQEGIERVKAQMLQENFQMQKLCRRFGFSLQEEGKLLFAEKILSE